MTSNEYQISAMRTCMESCHNEAYALSGITAEVGELNDKVAKWIRKGICRWEHNRLVFNTSDEAVANKYREELAYELGDIRWFVALLSLLFGYTDEKIEQMNIEKLKDRAMREIKFRGKRLDNGEWVFGDLHLNTPYPHIHFGFGNRAKIDTDTIGQFTGLHDKNGKEIYEGDIVKWILTMPGCGVNGGYEEYETEEIGEIKWDAGALHLGEYCAAGFAYESDDYAEIIGNIHDNPELLKTE